MTKIIKTDCPEYNFDREPDLKKIGKKIDKVLTDNFNSKDIILRCVQSGKHESKQALIDHIIRSGSDYYEAESHKATNMADRKIDLYGYACTVGKSNIGYHMLEGFHIFKPKCLEKPQYPVDIWMIYNPEQLENVEYLHQRYNVIARDGYLFKNKDDKRKVLIGLIIVN